MWQLPKRLKKQNIPKIVVLVNWNCSVLSQLYGFYSPRGMWHLPWHAGDSEGEGQNGQEDHAKTEQDLTTEEPWQPWSDNTRDRGVNSRNFAIFYDPVMTLFYDPSTSINPPCGYHLPVIWNGWWISAKMVCKHFKKVFG